jgi:hypothetical protein
MNSVIIKNALTVNIIHNKFILRETEVVVCIILAVLKRVPAITYTLDSPLGHHQTKTGDNISSIKEGIIYILDSPLGHHQT